MWSHLSSRRVLKHVFSCVQQRLGWHILLYGVHLPGLCCVLFLLILFTGCNSNINLPRREESGSAPTSPSLQLQDKNANNHSTHSPSPAPVENGNQISNGNTSVDNSDGFIFRIVSALHHSRGLMRKVKIHTAKQWCDKQMQFDMGCWRYHSYNTQLCMIISHTVWSGWKAYQCKICHEELFFLFFCHHYKTGCLINYLPPLGEHLICLQNNNNL